MRLKWPFQQVSAERLRGSDRWTDGQLGWMRTGRELKSLLEHSVVILVK